MCRILWALLGQGCLLEPLDGGQVLREAVLSVLLVFLLLNLFLAELAPREQALPKFKAKPATGAEHDERSSKHSHKGSQSWKISHPLLVKHCCDSKDSLFLF